MKIKETVEIPVTTYKKKVINRECCQENDLKHKGTISFKGGSFSYPVYECKYCKALFEQIYFYGEYRGSERYEYKKLPKKLWSKIRKILMKN